MKRIEVEEHNPHGAPTVRKDITVTERRPSPDHTPYWMAFGVLATLLVAGLFWVANKDDDRDDRVSTTNIVTQPVTTEAAEEPVERDVETFVSTSTVEIRDLRSNTDALAMNASAANRERINAYQSRIDSLEGQLQQVQQEGGDSSALRAQVDSELQAMRTEYAQLESELKSDTAEVREDADQAMATAESAQMAASTTAQQTELTAFAQQAESRVDQMESQLDSMQANPDAAQASNLSRLQLALENLSAKVSEMQAASDDTQRNTLKNEIDTSLADLEREFDDLNM